MFPHGIYTRVVVVALAVAVAALGRQLTRANTAPRPDPADDGWSVINSPYGPGRWLTGPTTGQVTRVIVPPGARAFHEESDSARVKWRHLTIDVDVSVPPTLTVLDTHEVYTLAPERLRGWVLEQSIRYGDGYVRGADLVASIRAMGVAPELIDRALCALGTRESVDTYLRAVRATRRAKGALETFSPTRLRESGGGGTDDDEALATDQRHDGTSADLRFLSSMT